MGCCCGTVGSVSFPASFLKSSVKVLYTCAFLAANEPPTAAATTARSVTKARAMLRITVVGRSLDTGQTGGDDGFSGYDTCKPSGR